MVEGVKIEPERSGFDQKITLKPGQEWHSEPLPFPAVSDITIQALGTGKFYATFLDRNHYFKQRNPLKPFPFLFAKDRTQFTARIFIEESDFYYVVLRAGIFNPSPVEIRLIVTVENYAKIRKFVSGADEAGVG